MKQEEFNSLVRAIVFASSTDCCMDADAVDGVIDALKTFISENSALAKDVDFGNLYIYGNDPEMQEDGDINEELFYMFGDKLKNHE